ncbi:uncharacterized protein BomBc2 [Drosophila kikkawai]|uniref:Uncharacterized protein BomBc2 n=1 Tax=Drosophila kikkawai TaxID=30033 RepID=A0A6P4IPD0_DROKI|nr:uncharacterized protein LOC108076819 [Drosophila kikkawai]KAH8309500.1 hypothetical protein KR059_011199 [Drosophila kikkawai]
MKCLTLLALLVLATLAFVQAGKVSIKGECVHCNEHPTTTTRKPSPARGNGGKTTAKPRSKTPPARKDSDSDEDDDDLSGWSLHQTSGGAQHIANRRHKRQWGRGWGGSEQYIGGWTGNGPVTTIDSRGTPDTIVRNSDCVGCNIRG